MQLEGKIEFEQTLAGDARERREFAGTGSVRQLAVEGFDEGSWDLMPCVCPFEALRLAVGSGVPGW